MLQLLEARLGLVSGLETSLQRVEAYQQALFAEKSGAFYERSFEQDPLAVAGRLLQWRDELKLEGWEPQKTGTDAPNRLKTLARVEKKFSLIGEPERVAAILRLLAGGTVDSGVESIVVIGNREILPRLWRELLDQLPVAEKSGAIRPAKPLAEAGTALAKFQARLLGLESGEVIPADESLTLYGADSESTLAAGAGEWLVRNSGRETAIVGDPAEFGSLNQVLATQGSPRLPERTVSTGAALLNLLPLTLRLSWEPFDPQAWIEFLLHPVHPVSAKIRFRLASSLNQTPGYRNAAWNTALQEVLASVEGEERTRLENQIATWLEPEQADPAGANAALFAEKTRALGTWLGLKEEYRNASAAVFRFEALLRGDRTVSRLELERLLAAWLRENAESEGDRGQVGQPWPIRRPAHLLEPQDHVLAWKPTGSSPPVLPLFPSERTWLTSQGIQFPDSKQVLLAQEEATQQLALCARKSLAVFVAPSNSELHDRPSGLVLRIAGETTGVERDAASLIPTAKTPLRPLPEPRRWWTLPNPAALQLERQESYSSLQKWVYSPYQWVFSYAAKLQTGCLLDFRVLDEARRQGALLHGFVESLFEPDDETNVNPSLAPALEDETPVQGIVQILVKRLLSPEAQEGSSAIEWQSVQQEAVSNWVRQNWDALLAEQAAHYLVLGFEASRQRLLHLAESALWRLILHLREAGVTEAQCEMPIEDVDFVGGKLRGFIDLVVRTQDGKTGVIDLKLGGYTSRKMELEKNVHLQLALYGHLLQSTEGVHPACAYFIFKGNGKILARSQEFYPDAPSIYKARDTDWKSDWQACWNDFEEIWRWRKAQFDAGKIEFTTAATTPDESSHPPRKTWTAPKTADRYNDFAALCGWPHNA
tara:strand:- start:59 stop:2698 length:2640 start_codon:yes stop_codon:yes gene_type:complete